MGISNLPGDPSSSGTNGLPPTQTHQLPPTDKRMNLSHLIIKNDNKEFRVKPNPIQRADQKSGLSEQFTLDLVAIDGSEIKARGKKIENLNEAIVFQRLKTNKDPLNKFIPSFLTVIDKHGKEINLEELLKTRSPEELCKDKEFKDCYLIMNDLIANLGFVSLDESVKIRDFKFARKSLQGQNFETELHEGKTDNFFYKMMRRAYFSLSGCSFAFQKSTKVSNWFSAIFVNIKRALTLRRTKNEILTHLDRLPKEQLKALKGHLIEMNYAFARSNIALADASLLFVPIIRYENGKEIKDLNINLIDLSHGVAFDEIKNPKAIAKYGKMKSDFQTSINELITNIDVRIARN